MEFRILGSLEVRDEDGRQLTLDPGRQRALLAILLLNAPELVSSDRLIDELWGERAPATAAKIVQNYISRLRRALGDEHLVSHGHAYGLVVPPEALDAAQFESLVARGARALAIGDPEAASISLHQALALWRGPALADFAYEPFAQPAIARLEERRLEATEARIEADLALGRHGELVGELDELVQRNPLRERLHAQRMLALYRSGRQADALGAYRAIRTALVDELGLEPGEELQKLHRAILEHDPELAVPQDAVTTASNPAPASAQSPSRRRPRGIVLVLVGAVLAVGIALVLVLSRSSNLHPTGVVGNSVAIVDLHSQRIVDEIALHSRPTVIAANRTSAWVASSDTNMVTRIDAKTGRVTATIRIAAPASDIALDTHAVWVTTGRNGHLISIDQHTNRFERNIALSGSGDPVPEVVSTVVVGAGAIWVGTGAGAVLKINPRTGRVLDRIAVGAAPVDIALAADNLWVVSVGGYVLRIDAKTDRVTGVVPLGPYARAITVGEGAVWITSAPREGGGLIWRIDPITLTVMGGTATLDQAPGGITSGGGAIWVAGGPSGMLFKINPSTGRSAAYVDLGNAPVDVAYATGRLWVAVVARQLSFH